MADSGRCRKLREEKRLNGGSWLLHRECDAERNKIQTVQRIWNWTASVLKWIALTPVMSDFCISLSTPDVIAIFNLTSPPQSLLLVLSGSYCHQLMSLIQYVVQKRLNGRLNEKAVCCPSSSSPLSEMKHPHSLRTF